MKWEAKAEDDEEQVGTADAAWQAVVATVAGWICWMPGAQQRHVCVWGRRQRQ